MHERRGTRGKKRRRYYFQKPYFIYLSTVAAGVAVHRCYYCSNVIDVAVPVPGVLKEKLKLLLLFLFKYIVQQVFFFFFFLKSPNCIHGVIIALK